MQLRIRLESKVAGSRGPGTRFHLPRLEQAQRIVSDKLMRQRSTVVVSQRTIEIRLPIGFYLISNAMIIAGEFEMELPSCAGPSTELVQNVVPETTLIYDAR